MRNHNLPAGNRNLRQRIDTAKELLPLRALIEHLGDWDDNVTLRLCPFHDDHSPSFSIFESPSGTLWKCHSGCGAGDQINYLELKFEITRGEAITMFLQLAGLDQEGGE